jgi:hypothetical protein
LQLVSMLTKGWRYISTGLIVYFFFGAVAYKAEQVGASRRKST